MLPPSRVSTLMLALLQNDVAKAVSWAAEGCRLIDDFDLLPEEGECTCALHSPRLSWRRATEMQRDELIR